MEGAKNNVLNISFPIATAGAVAVVIVSLTAWVITIANKTDANAAAVSDIQQNSKSYATKEDVTKVEKSVGALGIKIDDKFDKLNDYLLSNKR